MAQYDGSIRIDTQLNTKEFEKNSKNLISGMKRLGNSLNKIIGSIGFGLGIAGLIRLGKQAIDTASDISEVQNVVDTAFGDMSYKMEEFADTAVKQFGISRLSAKETGSTFMAMGRSMVDSMETASNMAIALTGRAADMASFYNKSFEETSTALKSIYTGETETLKAYGVVMTEVNLQEFAATQGITKKISAMTQAEKVQLRYNYVMQQTSLAAGDFAKTSDSWANQTRILTEQFKELSSVIGTGLIAALTPVVKFLNTILTQAIAIAKQIGAILGKLFGISVPVASAAKSTAGIASGMEDAADSMDSAAGSAGDLEKGVKAAGKAAKRSLAPFDKLNVLSKEASGGGGSGSGAEAGGGGFEMPQIELKEEAQEAGIFSDTLKGILDRLKELKNLFSAGFWDGLGDYKPILDGLGNDLDSIWQTLKNIFTDPEVVSSADNFFNSLAFASGQVVGSMASIGLTIASNLVGGMEKYLTQNTGRIKEYIIEMFDVGSEIVSIIGGITSALADIFSVFAGDTAQQITGDIIGIFAEVGMMISETALKLGRDILNMITKPIIDNKDKIKTAIEETLKAIEPFTDGLLIAVQTVSNAVSEIYDEHLKPLFDSITEGLSTVLGKLLDGYNEYIAPVLQELGERFKEIMEGPFGETVEKIKDAIGKLIDAFKLLWENVLVPLFSWIASNIMPVLAPIVDFIGNTILTVFETVINVIGDIADVIGGIIDFIVGVFTGDWEKAWNGIESIFSGVWNAIKDVFSGIWDIIKNLVKNGLEYVKKRVTTIWESVKTVTSAVWNGIKTSVTNVWNGLKSTVSTVFNGIKTKIVSIWNTIKTSTKSIWDGIKNAIKTSINAIIGFINKMISGIVSGINSLTGALNKIKIDIPEGFPVIGGKSLGFDIPKVTAPQIPQLANGAVIRGGDPFIAELGEQPRWQTNVEAPLSTIEKAVTNAIIKNGGAGGGEYTFVAQLNGKTIFEETVRQDQMFRKAKGHSAYAY